MLNANQLIWRCRRGVRELDILLGRFVETDYPLLDQPGQLAFQRLLDIQDPVIMDWLFGKARSEDPELVKIIERLQIKSGLDKRSY